MEALPHPATFPTPEHERVHDLLRRLISEGSARFFADACELSQGSSALRTTTHLVGHLVREVESAVRQVLRTLPPAQDILNGTKDHRRQVDAILEVFSLANDHVAIQWREFVGDSGSWARTAHRDDLRRQRELDAIFSQRFELFVAVLLAVLDAAEANYSMVIAALETVVLKAAPSPADISLLAANLAPGVTALSHIFKSLSAAWLVPLRDLGVFSEPPDTQVHDGGAISFPRWPQAEYLARIACEAPPEVATTIESVPTVDNESIHGAFLLAAKQMPPAEAARIAFHEAKWLGAHRWVSSQIPEALQNLVTHLIAGEEVAATVSLLRVALSLTPVDRETLPGGESEPSIPSWAFEEVVQKALRPLAARASEAAIVLLFDLIDGSGQASESWTWRKAIEEHQQNRHDDPIDHLLSVLRDLYDERVRGDAKALRAAVVDLENRGKNLYRRIALYLLRQHGESTPDLIVDRAVDQARLDDHEEFHELACMIADRFASLDDVDRRKVVAALRQNSSVEHFRSKGVGAESDEQAEADAKWRRRSWFAVLGPSRPADVNAEYQLLCADVGEPENPTFMVWSSSLQGGSAPPRLADDLLRLADPELLTYLREWVPTPGDPFGASFRDLGREVKACATREPIRMSRLAREFRAQHPQYVTAIIWGVHEATINKTTASADIDWLSILDLAEWVVQQSNHPSDEAARAPESWTWTRQMVVAVAEDAATLATDVAIRCRAWKITSVLLRDEDPSAERIGASGKDDDDFPVNTVRGQAMYAAVATASAFARSGVGDLKAAVEDILDQIEGRLDPGAEPSAAIRTVVAKLLTTLITVDEKRAVTITGKLLPNAAGATESGWAAWLMFLKSNRPNQTVFARLEEHYQFAVHEVASGAKESAAELGVHLTWLAAWGVIKPQGSDSLLQQFIESASPKARHAGLDAVGRALYRTKEPISPDAVTRLKGLWQWWFDATVNRDGAFDLTAFGWWFSSSIFDSPWSLSMLLQVLEATGGAVDWDHEVLKKLPELADTAPNEVVACLARLVDRDKNNRIGRCRASIRKALTNLSTGPSVLSAKAIASRLVAREWPEFRDLA